jgi:PPOX class probable FMN-dependent enzyme
MIQTLDALRALYAPPNPRSVAKQLARLDAHCQRFIALSPFVVVASGGGERALDASPRGGAPGFVKVMGDITLLIPDSPGNNRLDTLENIVADGRIGLLFMIPGVDETLRVNGSARLDDDPERTALAADEKRTPRLVIEVQVAEAYLHCAKAFMRSKLWSAEARVQRGVLPTMGEMLKDHTGSADEPESQESMLARYVQAM